MTNEEHHVDDTDGAGDPEAVKRELLAAWMAVHPGGTPQQFEDEWRTLTSSPPPRPRATGDRSPASEDQDPAVIKHRLFEEWRAYRPDGTRAQFEAEWETITSVHGD
jgi:hypothetical protein